MATANEFFDPFRDILQQTTTNILQSSRSSLETAAGDYLGQYLPVSSQPLSQQGEPGDARLVTNSNELSAAIMSDSKQVGAAPPSSARKPKAGAVLIGLAAVAGLVWAMS